MGYSFVGFEGSELLGRQAESDDFLEVLEVDIVAATVGFERPDSLGGR